MARRKAFCERLVGHALEEPGVGVLCLRHEQNSLDDSVKATIEGAVDRMNVRKQFGRKLKSEIRTKMGSVFKFLGMQHAPSAIKGRTKFKYFFVDEGADVTRAEWRMLLPTIRAHGAILYIAINPTRAEDPLYADFHIPDEKTGLIPIENALMLKFRWQDLEHLKLPDGEWLLSRTLLEHIKRAYRVNPAEAEHVWGGGLAIRQDALVFQKDEHWSLASTKFSPEMPHVKIPWHAETRYGIDFPGTHTLGVVLRSRVWDNRIHIEQESVKRGANDVDFRRMIGEIIREDGAVFHTDQNFRLSAAQTRNGWGYSTKMARKGPDSVEAGIRWLRTRKITVEPTCKHTIREFSTWSYKIDQRTQEVKLPEKVQDINKDCIDALRYSVESMIVGDREPRREHPFPSKRGTFGGERMAPRPRLSSDGALKRRVLGY